MRCLRPGMLNAWPCTSLARFCSTIARLGAVTAKCGSAVTISANCDRGVEASSSPPPSCTSIAPMLLALPSAVTAQTT